jgi:hypothetical protein
LVTQSVQHLEECWDTGYQLVGHLVWQTEQQTQRAERWAKCLERQLDQHWVEHLGWY